MRHEYFKYAIILIKNYNKSFHKCREYFKYAITLNEIIIKVFIYVMDISNMRSL